MLQYLYSLGRTESMQSGRLNQSFHKLTALRTTEKAVLRVNDGGAAFLFMEKERPDGGAPAVVPFFLPKRFGF